MPATRLLSPLPPLVFALALFACDEPLTPVQPAAPEPEAPVEPRRAVMEITIGGIGSDRMFASAAVVPSSIVEAAAPAGGAGAPASAASSPSGLVSASLIAPGNGVGDGTIQLRALSTGSFTDGVRGEGGVRYIWATYEVRNAQSDGTAYASARENLTFVPVAGGGTIGATPFSKLARFDGADAAASIADAMVPTGRATKGVDGSLIAVGADILQAFEEAEVAAVAGAFPYGFVVRHRTSDASRELPASPAADEYDGVVTFAYKVPLQPTAEEDPFTVTLRVQAMDDDETRITQSFEEQGAEAEAAFDARAAALGATVITTLPGDASTQSTRCLSQVRTAGAAGAGTHTLSAPTGELAGLRLVLPGETFDPCGNTGSASDQIAGASFDATVQAVDTRGYALAGVTNQVSLTSDDAQAVLPAAAALVDGAGTFAVELRTAGTPSLTATDDTDAASAPYTGELPLRPADLDPAASTLAGDAARQVMDGTVVFTLTGVDRFGNAGATAATVALATTLGSVSALVHEGGGVHTGTLTMPAAGSPSSADTARVTATVGGSGGGEAVAVYLFAWQKVSAGHSHTCGVATDGAAYCWGDASDGVLGNGATTGDQASPAAVDGSLAFSSVTAGTNFTCGLTTAGAGYCWGADDFGQLGNGATTGIQSTPVAVDGALEFSNLDAGGVHVCGVTTTGAGYCWGREFSTELGNGATTGNQASPVAVVGGLAFSTISAGLAATCAVAGTSAYCWGSDGSGELGNGTAVTGDQDSPDPVAGALAFSSVSAAVGSHVCGVATDGSAYCWGDNQDLGVLGNGVLAGTVQTAPGVVDGAHSWSSLSTAAAHTCGVTTAGSAYCWGFGFGGPLGTGTLYSFPESEASPAAVAGGLVFARVSAGNRHTCGVTSDGRAYCWGVAGQLGNGSLTNQISPVPVNWPAM